MLAHVDFHPRMQWHHHQLPRRIARKGNAARTVRQAHDEWHSRQGPFHSALQRHHGHRRAIVFPQQDVVLEIHRIALAKRYLGHRNNLALDLASAPPKMYLGHVPDARRLTPARIANEVLDVERRPTIPARQRRRFIRSLAPVAFDPLERRSSNRAWLRRVLAASLRHPRRICLWIRCHLSPELVGRRRNACWLTNWLAWSTAPLPGPTLRPSRRTCRLRVWARRLGQWYQRRSVTHTEIAVAIRVLMIASRTNSHLNLHASQIVRYSY